MSDAFIWASKGAKSAVPLLSEAQDISPLGGSHNVSLLGQTSFVKVYIGTAVTQTVHRDILRPFGRTDGGIRKWHGDIDGLLYMYIPTAGHSTGKK